MRDFEIKSYWINAAVNGRDVTGPVTEIPAQTVAAILQAAAEGGSHVQADTLGFTVTTIERNGSLRVVWIEAQGPHA